MFKKNWMVAVALAVGVVGGLAFGAQSHRQEAPNACSHAGGDCTWSGDCCMNENLFCDTDSHGDGICKVQP